jgi:chemotaxis protein MotB
MSNVKDRPIFIKRVAAKKSEMHGGAWKLAYADFMTALMAFFLLLWLLSSVSPVQLAGIAEYFQMPLKDALSGGPKSSEGASILQGGGKDISRRDGEARTSDSTRRPADSASDPSVMQQGAGVLDKREQERLHDLQVKLLAAIEANPVLRQFRQQIRIDSTLTGLRIEIVDTQKRPMFATASDEVEPYMRDILREIGRALNDVPNRIVVQGHTDAVPYAGGGKGYSNWELSADRANASRRELIAGGMQEDKVLRVLGLASTQNLNKQDPFDPENRRISIIVLNRRAEQALLHEDAASAASVSNGSNGAGSLLEKMTPVAPAATPSPHSSADTAAQGGVIKRVTAPLARVPNALDVQRTQVTEHVAQAAPGGAAREQ